jgi:hypothetical protein
MMPMLGLALPVALKLVFQEGGTVVVFLHVQRNHAVPVLAL